jgi:hypothetical protein
MYNLYRLHQSPRNSFALSSLLSPSCCLHMLSVTQNIRTRTYVNVFFVCYWYCINVILHVVIYKLDYVSPVWKNISAIDVKNVAALCFTRFSSSHFLPLCLCTWAYKVISFTSWKAPNWCSFFIHVLQGLNFVFLLLKTLVLDFLLAVLENSPSFLQHTKLPFF